MKLKLKQRIAIRYYTTKFKALSLLSPRIAARSAFQLFCTPYSGKPKRIKPSIFLKAQSLQLRSNTIDIKGFKWLSNNSNNKTVLICHGFDSCSYKFDKLIASFLQNGYTVLAFDAPGHGISNGKTVNALLYSSIIIEIDNKYGPLDILVGHSLGGLAAALAMENLSEQEKRKLILLAPATETTRAIHQFFQFVPVNTTIRKEFDNLIINIGGKPISWYSVARIVPLLQCKTLWVHDNHDWICPLEDIKPVQNLQLNHVQFFITTGLGHNRIHRDAKVQEAVISFSNS